MCIRKYKLSNKIIQDKAKTVKAGTKLIDAKVLIALKKATSSTASTEKKKIQISLKYVGKIKTYQQKNSIQTETE